MQYLLDSLRMTKYPLQELVFRLLDLALLDGRLFRAREVAAVSF